MSETRSKMELIDAIHPYLYFNIGMIRVRINRCDLYTKTLEGELKNCTYEY